MIDLLKPYIADGEDEVVYPQLSLSKLTGKKIVDLVGYIASPYGGEPTFGISAVVFDDGSIQHVEGSHDWAYVYWPWDNPINDLVQRIYDATREDEE